VEDYYDQFLQKWQEVEEVVVEVLIRMRVR
jgi:hypothetical protein